MYEVTIDYTKDYNGESWIATISDEKYIDMDTFERTKADLEAKLAEKDQAIEGLQEINKSLGRTCNNDAKEIERLREELAKKESEIKVGEFWHSAYEGKQLDYDKLNDDYNKQEKLLGEVLANKSELQFEYDQLKQQLAHKEKEIESLKFKLDIRAMSLQNINNERIQANQDKISFAVEQLKKVKEWVVDYSDLKGQNWDHTLKFLNNQIKQLKEMK